MTLYEGARFFWAVPDDTAPSELREVGDLARPEIAATFERSIRGLSLDTTITSVSIDMLDAYGLADAGFRVEPGSFEEWESSLVRAIHEGRNVVLPLWQPYHLNAMFKLRRLAEPRAMLGSENRVVLAARRGLGADLDPAALAALQRTDLTIDAVSAMDERICVGGLSPELAAAEWLDGKG